MRKVIFVKENYVNDSLHCIAVRYKDDLGLATAQYNPTCIPKYVKKFMEKHEKTLFTTEYDKKHSGIVTYIYR